MSNSRLNQSLVTLPGWVLFVMLARERLLWLHDHHFPISTDGFYYLMEIRNRMEGKGGYYSSFSPFFDLLAMIGRWIGATPEALFSGTVLVSILLAVLALARLTYQRSSLLSFEIPIAPYVGSAYLASDILFFRHYAFLHQGVAFSLLFAALALFYEAGRSDALKATRLKALALCVLLCAAALHSSVLVVVVCFLWILFDTTSVGSLLLLVGGGLPILRKLLLMEHSPFAIPPASWWPSWIDACLFSRCAPFEWYEFGLHFLMVGLVAGSVLLGARNNAGRQLPSQNVRVPLILALVALVYTLPIWNQVSHLSFRLALAAVWLSVAAVCTLKAVSDLYSQAFRRWVTGLTLVGALSVIGGHYALARREYVDPAIPPELLQRYAPSLVEWIPTTALVEAPHGSQFRVTYFLRRRAARADEQQKSKIQPTFRLTRFAGKKSRCRALPSYSVTNLGSEQCIALGEGWYLASVAR